MTSLSSRKLRIDLSTLFLPQRGGRGPGIWRERPTDLQAETQEQARAVSALVSEARSSYRSGAISAARDFFIMHVPSV